MIFFHELIKKVNNNSNFTDIEIEFKFKNEWK